MSARALDEAQRGLLQRLLALPAADWEIENVWERRAGFTAVIAAWIATQEAQLGRSKQAQW